MHSDEAKRVPFARPARPGLHPADGFEDTGRGAAAIFLYALASLFCGVLPAIVLFLQDFGFWTVFGTYLLGGFAGVALVAAYFYYLVEPSCEPLDWARGQDAEP